MVITAAKAMKYPLKRRSTESTSKNKFQWRTEDEKTDIKDEFQKTMPVFHTYE